MVNDSTMSLSVNVRELLNATDFIVVAASGYPSVMLIYENIAILPSRRNMDEAKYFDAVVKHQLKAVEQVNVSVVSTSTKKVAGEDWFVGTMSIYDGAVFQDYYLHKVDGIIYVLVATYTAETESEAAAVIAGIGKTRDKIIQLASVAKLSAADGTEIKKDS